MLGDSISAAYGMSLEQGWVALMQRELPAAEVINASISGETSGGALRRLPRLLTEHNPTLVIVELGGNDGLRGYPIPDLRRNLLDIVSVSRQNGAEVLLLPMEIPPNYGSRYTASFRESFQVVAESGGAQLGGFPLQGIATDPTLMQPDGIHPTVEAQPMIVANVLPVVRDMLPAP